VGTGDIGMVPKASHTMSQPFSYRRWSWGWVGPRAVNPSDLPQTTWWTWLRRVLGHVIGSHDTTWQVRTSDDPDQRRWHVVKEGEPAGVLYPSWGVPGRGCIRFYSRADGQWVHHMHDDPVGIRGCCDGLVVGMEWGRAILGWYRKRVTR